MKRLFISATIIFWVGVATIWASSHWAPAKQTPTTPAATKRYSMQSVAAHNRPDNCWMAINGQVYDLPTYLPQHPTAPDVIVPWCGKEATHAYVTKNRGRPHSPYATELLKRYWIGELEK